MMFVHEWHSWVPKAPVSGIHGCRKRPRVALMGAESVREWHSWERKAK